MDPTTIFCLNDCHSLQELTTFLKYTEPKLGFLGGRRFRHIDDSHSVSMHAIVSKFKTLCHQAPTGSVSEGEVRSLRQRIVQLNTSGSRLLEAAPWWKRILTYIFRIANIRFLFKNPITIADEEAASLTRRINQFLQEILTSVQGGRLPQDQCNRITSPALYKELILMIIRGKSIEECERLFNDLTIPESTQYIFFAVLQATRQELWATKAREYAQRLAQEPLPEGEELFLIQTFFQNYTTNIFSTTNKYLNTEELKSALQFFTSIEPIPLASQPDLLKRLVPFFEEILMDHFCFLMNAWTEAYKINHPQLFDFLSDLSIYQRMINDLFPEKLEAKEVWKAIQRGFSVIYEDFFSMRKEMFQEHSLIFWENPLRLSERYHFHHKRAINAWLKSFQEATTIVDDLSRELGHGITIGVGEEWQHITRATLEQELGKLPPSEEDSKCLLCWNVYQKIAAYLRNEGVQNPEEEAASLLSIANQNHPSYPSIQLLGGLLNHPVVMLGDEPHNWTFFYDETTETPSLKVHCAYSDEGKTLRTAITLRVQKEENRYTENLEFTPSV